MAYNLGLPEDWIVSPLVQLSLLLLRCPGCWRWGVASGKGVFVVNLLFGWEGIGWIAALVWALLSARQGEGYA